MYSRLSNYSFVCIIHTQIYIMYIWRQQRAAVKNYLSNIAWRPMRQKEGNFFFFEKILSLFLFPFNLTRVVLFLVLRNIFLCTSFNNKNKEQIGNLRSILYAAFYDAWPYCLWAALSALKLHCSSKQEILRSFSQFVFLLNHFHAVYVYMRTAKMNCIL